MICKFMYNSCTGVRFYLSEDFNEVECCTKLSGEMYVVLYGKKNILGVVVEWRV